MGSQAIGAGFESLGYGGIDTSVAIEFDTWYDEQQEDLYDNHVAVQTRGLLNPNSAHHMFALAWSSRVPELLDGKLHEVRIRYDPVFDDRLVHPGFCVDTMACGALQSRLNLGVLYSEGNFARGLGTLWLFIDQFITPVFIAPMQFDTLLNLTDGRALMGFTASTGLIQWQVPEIRDWTICTNPPLNSTLPASCVTVL